MKKTWIIPLLALCSTAWGAEYTLIGNTITGTSSGYTSTAQGWQRLGYIIDMNSAVTYTCDGVVVSDLSVYDSFTLDSLALATNASKTLKLAVFSIDSIDTKDGVALTELVGLTGTVTTLAGGTNGSVTTTFTFADSVTLDPTKSYGFFFMHDDVTAEKLATATSPREIINNGYLSLVSLWHSKSNLQGSEYREGGYYVDGELPIVTYTLTATKADPLPAIPEPATATLSLLALAGLAARRRRK